MARAVWLIVMLAAGLAAAAPPARIVAIGDVHGDLAALRCVLRRAGAIDARDRWRGGKLVVVQTGDLLDRGDDEPDVMAFLDRLAAEAARAGGRVIQVNGNHELMNVAGDLRYVTPDGFADYGGAEARKRAFAPGSPLALALAARPIYAVVGDTIFVHGGLTPAHLGGALEAMDAEARAWLRGEQPTKPRALVDSEGPLWTRAYAGGEEGCAGARELLDGLKLSRMVIGHSVQEQGINAICDGRVWRIDVGLAKAYGGKPQVLELRGQGKKTTAKVLEGCSAP